MARVASEANAVRHAHLGPSQGQRGSAQSAGSADKAGPFAALLDGTKDTPPPKSSPLRSPDSQTPAARPHDGQTPQPPTAVAPPGTQKSPPDSPPLSSQAGGASSPPSGPNGTDISAAELGALAKKAAKDSKPSSDTNLPATVPTNATDAIGGKSTVDAISGSSTVAAIPDIHDGRTDKSDPQASDPAQAAAPLIDPTANQAIPPPPPVAAVVSTPVITETSSGSGSGGSGGGGGSASGTRPDANSIAALGDSVAGALRGKADRAATDTAKSGPAPAAGTPQTDGGTTANAKSAAPAKSTPSLAPQPPQTEIIQPSGPSQANAVDGAPSRNRDGVAAKAAGDRASQLGTTGQPTDGTVGPQGSRNVSSDVSPDVSSNGAPSGNSNDNSSPDAKQNPAVTASQIEDIARQALDKPARRVEAATADAPGGGTPNPETSQAGSTQQSPDGSGSLIASASLTTAAAPADASATTTTPVAVPIAGLAVEIAAHARAGKNRFEIRLDPPELGRINVRLDVDHDGKVTSRLVVDRQETLDMLRRDAPELERSLQQAGLKTADNALQFSLRDQSGFGGQNPNPNHGSQADATRAIIPDRELPPVEMTAYGRTLGTRVGIDIRV